MINKIVVIIKLFCCILFFSQNIFAKNILANLEIISKDFDGQIDDKIKSYHYDHNKTTLYYLNSSLKLNIIDIKSNKINIVQLQTERDFLSTLPFNWVPNISLNANKEIIDSQLRSQLYQKISELKITISDNELFLIDNGGGMVFKIDLNDYKLKRDDSSFTTMNKFGGNVFTYNNDIYHFGGYGLYSTNSTLLKYNKEYKSWDEIVVKDKFPNPYGITNASILIWNDKLFIIDGQSTNNQNTIKNNKIISYDFLKKSWLSFEGVDLKITENDIISSSNEYFFIYNSELEKLTTLDVNKLEMNTYSINPEIKFQNGKGANTTVFNCSHLYKKSNKPLIGKTVNLKFTPLNEMTINYFVANSGTYQASIFKSFKFSEFVNIKTLKKEIVFTKNKSKNEFIVPLIIVLIILILNLFYKNYSKDKKIIYEKLYNYEDGILKFKNTLINIDQNTRLILDLLCTKEKIPSTDVVALLVSNGISMDYASKIKNKTIEKMNDKFEFVTGSKQKFISTFKSKEDKRIQILQLIK